MTKLQAIRWFLQHITNEKIIIARTHYYENQWSMSISGEPRLRTPARFDYKSDDDDILFRNNFIARFKPARGFSNHTLSILHEIGHWMTRKEIDWEEDTELREFIGNQEEYMDLESEWQATQWAIEWLNIKEHRRLAKQFEKEFFGY